MERAREGEREGGTEGGREGGKERRGRDGLLGRHEWAKGMTEGVEEEESEGN